MIDTIKAVPKSFVRGLKEQEIGGNAETIQNTALLRSARILRRLLEIDENCSHSDTSE